MACAEYIVCGELPFRHVENVAFKAFCFKLQPKFKPPSRTTVARDCYQLYLDMKTKLCKSMKKHRVSLTTGTWRSIQNINYMCVIAHFIDKRWVLHKRIINFFQVLNHKGETISRELETCMREWKINKLCSISVDNASSNDAALNSLRRKLCSVTNSIVLEPKFLHLRCGAHIINLVVNEGLKEIENSVASIRLACKFVRSSTVRQQLFEECCEREGIETKALLCLDVATRWNSTYLMLDTVIRFQKAFDGMVGDGNYDNYFIEEDQQPPTDDDWEQAREYTEFLKTFYMATKKFSGLSYTTSNLFLPEIFDISQKLDKMINQPNENPTHCMMAIRMKQKFDKYWGDAEKISDVLFVAFVLDPRFKFKLLRHFYAKCRKPQDYIEALCQKIEKLLKDLFSLYNKENPQSSNDKQNTQSAPVEVEEQESDLFAEYADPKDSHQVSMKLINT
ncbi:Ribonuclease H-like protein [Dioscorea alata]|uniref:Ribonuclease H-like protein n=1 Tax=Dioscorea alata TaxID=55571 RepID=A0ACB7UG68_DIOAL|nr:Ribonuclease H-like protein [Dioscorea alata]